MIRDGKGWDGSVAGLDACTICCFKLTVVLIYQYTYIYLYFYFEVLDLCFRDFWLGMMVTIWKYGDGWKFGL